MEENTKEMIRLVITLLGFIYALIGLSILAVTIFSNNMLVILLIGPLIIIVMAAILLLMIDKWVIK